MVILPLLILRPHPHLVRADYLAWAINQPDAQHRLNRESSLQSPITEPKHRAAIEGALDLLR